MGPIVKGLDAGRRAVLRAVVMSLGAGALSACAWVDALPINAGGPIARAELQLMTAATLIMACVVIAVIAATLVFAWRYRASAPAKHYDPSWRGGVRLELALWGAPAAIVALLAVLVWTYTHRLDPYRQLGAEGAVRVQVVAQSWKWLFIYPELGVASVNELVIPTGRPVSLEITADTAMSSFYVPALSGQIYAMAGMRTQLNLRADRNGRFSGRNVQFSGAGFPEQTFVVAAVNEAEFEAWVGQGRIQGGLLDAAEYERLRRPSTAVAARQFRVEEAGLFERVMARYGAHRGHDCGTAICSED